MYLYLLENSESKKYYIGVTESLERRVKEHNEETNHFTGKGGGIWRIIRTKSIDKNAAYKEEKRLKKCKNRKYIEWYFSQLGP